MSDFYIGQEVVCVNDRPIEPKLRWEHPLMVNAHYRICWVGEYTYAIGGKQLAVRLEGVKRLAKFGDVPFFVARFAPVKESTIQIFREMCRAVSIRHRTPEDIQNEFEGKGR